MERKITDSLRECWISLEEKWCLFPFCSVGYGRQHFLSISEVIETSRCFDCPFQITVTKKSSPYVVQLRQTWSLVTEVILLLPGRSLSTG